MICRARSSVGYTLLEVSLTISIGILILLTVTPALGNFINERKLRAITKLILECAAEARIAAKQQGKTVILALGKNEIQTLNGKHKSLPKNMKLLLKTEATEWTTTKSNWMFFPSGIIEPISLRLEQGAAWIEMDIDPLTGMALEERYSF
ncbi:MAG: hypothetical protein C5B47_05820 [Verrucomicrobia bacterium]|nr:MAG: hypothetical protein C5B47_05820 [Verrucomicrobiota bacterium]